MLDMGKERGVPVAALVGTAQHALRQVEAGVDILVVSGGEAGGHCGDVSTLVLVPEVHEAIAGLRRTLDEFPDRVLIGEIYLPIERLMAYYGRDLEGAHMPFNFALLSTPWRARDIAKLVDDTAPANYYRALKDVAAWAPEDAIIIGEGASTMDIGRTQLFNSRPRHRLDAGSYGTMGIGMGFVVAAAVVHPDKPIVSVSGDSAIGFSGMEMETVCRYQLPVKIVVFNKGNGTVKNPRTGKDAPMKPLDGEPSNIPSGDDPRARLADWLASPQNPFFARAVVNRTWAHFMGKGIVDPVDDMRVTNPPSNPELLDALARDFIDHGFSLKHLVRVIVKSRTYQLSSAPNQFNQHDKQNYARYYPRRLSAEVLYDAVNQVVAAPAGFGGLPTDRHAPNRAIMLPDESFQSYFLDVLGRPQRVSACECERVNEASLALTLHLLNSQEVQDRITRAGGRADRLARDPRPDGEKLAELFLLAVGTSPTAEQLALAKKHLAKHEKDKKIAYENFIWALINSKAFLFNQ